MSWPFSQDDTIVLSVVFSFFGVALLLSFVLVLWLIWWIRRIDLPAGADFADALRAAPLIVVVALDVLDMALDLFSAPVTWFLLSRLGLAPLRGVAVVKDLIPFTNFIPLMTLSWIVVRLLDREQRRSLRQVLHLPR
jgi:hypothetical protein